MQDYFYVDQDQQQAGPVSPEHFVEAGVTASTLVWRKGLDEWTPAAEVEELAPLFATESIVEAPVASLASRPANAAFSQPMPAQAVSTAPAGVSSNLWLAVLSALFMLNPLGIVAVHHAAKVDFYNLSGNTQEAVRRSHLAMGWSVVALLVSVVWLLFLVSTFGSTVVSYFAENYEFVF